MSNSTIAYHILRVGLGLTFVWMGILIWQSPELYGSFLAPWAQGLVGELESTMRLTAVVDIVLGILLIAGWWAWLFGVIASVHLLLIIVGMGNLSDIAARDLGLLAAALSVTVWQWPKRFGSDQSDKKTYL